MKVAIDARWIFAQISGIGAYTRELIRHLARADRGNEYILFFDDRARMDAVAQETDVGAAPNFAIHLLPYGVFSPRGQFALGGLLGRLGVDVYHSTNYMIPFPAFPRNRRGRTACVVTIHDMIPLLFPQYTPRAKKTRFFPLYRGIMMEVGRRADVILADSEASRRDVISGLRLPRGREDDVLVVPAAVGRAFRPGERGERNWRTLLYVGRMDPYKNVEGLVRVFAAVRAETKTDVRLKIIGPPDERYPEAVRLADELGLNAWIEWCGYATSEALVEAYQQADVFVLLSRYEGFGLPVLEAMACGTPVVCSNGGSLPEVAADAALTVGPEDTRGAVAAILRLLGDPSLASGLREKGLRQAAKFSWERTAELTMAAYARAAGG